MAAEDEDICDELFSASHDKAQAAVNYHYQCWMIFGIIFALF